MLSTSSSQVQSVVTCIACKVYLFVSFSGSLLRNSCEAAYTASTSCKYLRKPSFALLWLVSLLHRHSNTKLVRVARPYVDEFHVYVLKSQQKIHPKSVKNLVYCFL